MARAKKQKAGKLSIADMRKIVNKKAGITVAHDLKGSNPTEVKEWIPTGSRWLDSIICKGKLAGIPVGKVINFVVLCRCVRFLCIFIAKLRCTTNLFKVF